MLQKHDMLLIPNVSFVSLSENFVPFFHASGPAASYRCSSLSSQDIKPEPEKSYVSNQTIKLVPPAF